jgi:MYXO-CTERM domain-containing protein
MKRLGLALGAVVVLASARAEAFCPSYTPAQTAGGQNCGIDPVPGTNPDVAAWQLIFAKVAPGAASWGTDGPTIGTMGSGCGKPNPKKQVPAHFPCHVLQAIAMQESGWRQFCVPDTPAASVGAPSRTIVSFDCGYGIGQVTSGMHVGENPSFDRQRVAADPTYNMATGTRILRDKWAATNCVGDNDPDLVEDWYTAIWAYNGLAYSNNPNNPNLTAGRGVYNPKNGGSYAYQERVLGWMENPPADGRWKSLAVAYPNRGEIGSGGSPPDLSEPSCASPTDCTKTRSTHASSCGTSAPVDAGTDAAPVDAAPVDAGPPPAPAVDEGGCSCRTAPARGPRSATGLVLVGLAVALARLRRRDRSAR